MAPYSSGSTLDSGSVVAMGAPSKKPRTGRAPLLLGSAPVERPAAALCMAWLDGCRSVVVGRADGGVEVVRTGPIPPGEKGKEGTAPPRRRLLQTPGPDVASVGCVVAVPGSVHLFLAGDADGTLSLWSAQAPTGARDRPANLNACLWSAKSHGGAVVALAAGFAELPSVEAPKPKPTVDTSVSPLMPPHLRERLDALNTRHDDSGTDHVGKVFFSSAASGGATVRATVFVSAGDGGAVLKVWRLDLGGRSLSMVSHFVARAGLVTSLVFVSSGGVNPEEMATEPTKRSQAALAPAPLRQQRVQARPPPVPTKAKGAAPLPTTMEVSFEDDDAKQSGADGRYLGPDGQPPLPLMDVDLVRHNPHVGRLNESHGGRGAAVAGGPGGGESGAGRQGRASATRGDGSMACIICGYDSGALELWPMRAREGNNLPVTSFRHHGQTVTCLDAMTGGGEWRASVVVSASLDRSLAVWAVESQLTPVNDTGMMVLSPTLKLLRRVSLPAPPMAMRMLRGGGFGPHHEGRLAAVLSLGRTNAGLIHQKNEPLVQVTLNDDDCVAHVTSGAGPSAPMQMVARRTSMVLGMVSCG